jgi:methylenetetrahydrofolate dehydrogenase (NADP+)/methenyltetrahydrofolate cyclohydrolase
MELIDGKALSRKIQDEIAEKVVGYAEKGLRKPHLAAVLVGDDPASQVYVRNKVRSCERVGFSSTLIRKSAETSREELLDLVSQLNSSDEIDGFIVQLPLPKHLDEHEITLAIDPSKDVDGFHPVNFGKMAQGLPSFLPATPYGILMMLERYGVETSGKHYVVLGRSNIVGTPMAILLSRKAYPGNCTVTICHSRTPDIKAEIERADILVAAIGIPEFVKGDMVKEGVVVIDVGINRVEATEEGKTSKLVGDVDFATVAPKASLITPVPGGVGPMTVTALMMNTLRAFEHRFHVS